MNDKITVKELISILSEFDDDTVVEFEFNKERCPLTENFIDDNGKLVFKEHYRNIRHHIDGRYFADHTARKGFWIEDKATDKRYYFNDSNNIGKVRDLLNEYEKQLTGKTYTSNRVIM